MKLYVSAKTEKIYLEIVFCLKFCVEYTCTLNFISESIAYKQQKEQVNHCYF